MPTVKDIIKYYGKHTNILSLCNSVTVQQVVNSLKLIANMMAHASRSMIGHLRCVGVGIKGEGLSLKMTLGIGQESFNSLLVAHSVIILWVD